jgi:hypothetical protein
MPVAAHRERPRACVEELANRWMTGLILSAVGALVHDDQVALVIDHGGNARELLLLCATSWLARVAHDSADAPDAQSVDDDARTVEHVNVVGHANDVRDIVMVSCDADDPRKDVRECLPHRGDITEAATLVRSGHAVEIACEHDSGACGWRYYTVVRQLHQQVYNRDAE